MVGEPGQHIGVLVSRVVVEDGVDHLAGRHGPLDGRDEADELLMPMARDAASDDLTLQHAQGGEQGRGTVAFVVVGHGRALAALQRKTRLGAVEGLDLALLVDGHHHRVPGRVHVKADDIVELGGELGIGRALEGPDPMRLQLVCLPDALDGSQRQVHGLGHGPAGPMRDCAGWLAQGALDHSMDLGLQHRRDAGRTGLVAQQTLEAFFGITLLPAPHHRPAHADPLGDLQHRQTLSRQQDDLRPLDVLHGPASVLHDPMKPGAIFTREEKRDGLSHSDRLAQPKRLVNPPFASVH